ncbi:Putative respiratory nitrate reductase gamma subunit (narV) [Desulfamplus magnetovallimortis]|uniref:Putative respiratory nitrate reductase gamma subunit (NarV) n=1 Tax=Desulfamplus magnetovallimortis TaxID=1246637 RepID=L0R447_9BACT|nr:nitrate reductase [Desulfamplus magnetovallimortis]CCO06659.1 Putative respiratory nitrate reductase gamma subunit (narV) [Desulfamplus magnetovallimortis BW-1]SLM32710.1 Putative respiratory nitrate reductase gamma subunit (narV) [Desulfamplus magnetovallimortis]
MYSHYEFVTGPFAWMAFLIFIFGSIYRFYSLYKLARKKDGAVFEYMDLKFALRSIGHWLTPFGSRSMKLNPSMTVVTFLFHISLFLVPIFVFGHVVLWKENFDISWFTLPNIVADIMTLIVICSCAFFLWRRIKLPEVRYLTTVGDYVILLIVAAPFITGFWAYHQFPGFAAITIIHIISGEIMLIAIPFTKLFHMFTFPFTRGYIGSEFGGIRMAKDW